MGRGCRDTDTATCLKKESLIHPLTQQAEGLLAPRDMAVGK